MKKIIIPFLLLLALVVIPISASALTFPNISTTPTEVNTKAETLFNSFDKTKSYILFTNPNNANDLRWWNGTTSQYSFQTDTAYTQVSDTTFGGNEVSHVKYIRLRLEQDGYYQRYNGDGTWGTQYTSWLDDTIVGIEFYKKQINGSYTSLGMQSNIYKSNFTLTNGLTPMIPDIPQPTEVTVLKPSPGYIDTVDGFETLISFKMPQGTPGQLVNILFISETFSQTDFQLKQWEYNQSTGIGLAKFFTSPCPVGTHNITIKINGIERTATYQRLGGVVDEDEDGLDDRTGLPIGDGHAQVPNSETVWETMVNALNGSKELFAGIIVLCGTMFMWIPSEIRAIVLLAITITFIIMLKKLLTK